MFDFGKILDTRKTNLFIVVGVHGSCVFSILVFHVVLRILSKHINKFNGESVGDVRNGC